MRKNYAFSSNLRNLFLTSRDQLNGVFYTTVKEPQKEMLKNRTFKEFIDKITTFKISKIVGDVIYARNLMGTPYLFDVSDLTLKAESYYDGPQGIYMMGSELKNGKLVITLSQYPVMDDVLEKEISNYQYEKTIESLDNMNAIELMTIFNKDLKVRAYMIRSGYLEKAIGQFKKLDGNLLALIAKNLAPFEVILFCTRSLAFQNLCGQKSFWSSMLSHQYSEYITDDQQAKREYFEKTDFWYSISLRWFEGEQITLKDHLGNEYPEIIGTIKSDPPKSFISIPLDYLNNELYPFGYPVRDLGEGRFWYSIPYNFISSRSTVWLGITYITFSEFSWGRGGNGKESVYYLYGKTKLDVVREFVNLLMKANFYQEERRLLPTYREDISEKELIELTVDYIDKNGFIIFNNFNEESNPLSIFSVSEVQLQNSNSPDYDIYEEDFIDDYDRKRKSEYDGDLKGEPFY